ncbi:MAG: ketoacyl-ACP synthase III [Planctomycetaceae bacterium]|jgi:3-oxoacyl-[acyl-carrier-protein] synthase-3|nr:ketoacyl-ACP synthase III [Planctomycetaceae bacterium]
MFHVKISGLGSYLPERCIHNNELAETLETSDEWITSHTGISYRRIAAPDESPSSMAIEAAKIALADAGVAPEELSMILLSTSTPDYAPIPSTSCLVQEAIHAENSVAIDITAACSGFVFNLELARGYMQFHDRPILLVATEMMSRVIDWSDHKTCVLFGDAAAAAVLTRTEGEGRIIDSYIRADGTGKNFLKIEGGCRKPDSRNAHNPLTLYMEGRAVFTFAIRIIPDIVNILLTRNGLTLDDIDWLVSHQANYRIIRSAAARLKVPESRFFMNLQNVANTASATVPLALHEMQQKGLLKKGMKIITLGFGAGLTYGGNLIQW